MKRWDETLRRLPAGPCTAVEVGVWRGQMSDRLLAGHSALTLYLVDLWAPGADNESWRLSGSKMAAEPRSVVEAAFAGVVALAERYAPRARIVREASASAAARFESDSFDMVFIDADHSQQAVLADITAWRPKVRAGGWIGGHDYGSRRFPGVESAVHMVFSRADVERGANGTWWARP